MNRFTKKYIFTEWLQIGGGNIQPYKKSEKSTLKIRLCHKINKL